MLRFVASLSKLVPQARRMEDRVFRQLAEHTNDLLWLLDPQEMRLFYVSAAYQRITGLPTAALYGDPASFLRLIHPDERAQVAERLRAQIAGRWLTEVEYRIVRADGGVRWLRSRSFPITGTRGARRLVAGITEDVTARKEAEAALQRSEAQYRLLFEQHPQPMLIYDPQTLELLAVNDAAVRHYGYSREEFLKLSVRELRPVQDRPQFEAASGGRCRCRHQRRGGAIMEVEIVTHAVDFGGRRAHHVLVEDITEQLRVSEALRESEAIYHRMFEESPLPMWVYERQPALFGGERVGRGAVRL